MCQLSLARVRWCLFCLYQWICLPRDQQMVALPPTILFSILIVISSNTHGVCLMRRWRRSMAAMTHSALSTRPPLQPSRHAGEFHHVMHRFHWSRVPMVVQNGLVFKADESLPGAPCPAAARTGGDVRHACLREQRRCAPTATRAWRWRPLGARASRGGAPRSATRARRLRPPGAHPPCGGAP
jgi:hypothetical protein